MIAMKIFTWNLILNRTHGNIVFDCFVWDFLCTISNMLLHVHRWMLWLLFASIVIDDVRRAPNSRQSYIRKAEASAIFKSANIVYVLFHIKIPIDTFNQAYVCGMHKQISNILDFSAIWTLKITTISTHTEKEREKNASEM